MREIRRDLHRHPELGLQEKRTSGIGADYLERMGLDVKMERASKGLNPQRLSYRHFLVTPCHRFLHEK
jgi:hypothetical protein